MKNSDLDMKDAMELAIYREIGARDFYARISDEIENKEGKDKFHRLSEDEEGHRIKLESWFKQLFSKEFVPDPGGVKQSEIRDYSIDSRTGAMAALDIAIKAEAKANEFYALQADKADSQELKEMFLGLAEEEKGHYNLLEAERNSLIGGFYWFDMDSSYFLED